jgi:DMSO/TMAO reductase YedYZ heme-binding membrane subunit
VYAAIIATLLGWRVAQAWKKKRASANRTRTAPGASAGPSRS